MKRLATNASIALLGLIGILALALYYGTQRVLEHYRPQLLAEITDAVGCPVTYSRATLRLTPLLEVVLHDVAVMGTDLGFEVTAPYFSAEVKFSALLNRHLDFDRLTLRSPSIVLITGSKTQPQPPQATVPPLAGPATITIQPEVSRPLPGINAIAIDSGQIKRRSATGEESLVLQDLHITSRVVSQGQNLSVLPSQASFVLPVRLKGEQRLPFAASLQGLQYTASPKSIAVSDAQLSTGTSSVLVSGSMNLESGVVNANLQGTQVGIGVIQQILGIQGLSGRADIQSTLSIDEQTTRIDANITLSDARAAMPTGEVCGVGSLSGPISVIRTKGTGLTIQSSKLTVRGFSYQDPNVALNRVNGTLSKISGSIRDDGITTVTVTVQGNGLDLASGPFTIKKISSVAAPLTISIPGKGYSVSGPVTASGVEMAFHGRAFSAAEGAVQMLVSNDILRFVTDGIRSQSAAIPLSVRGTLEITDKDYLVKNLVGTIGNGNLAASADIQRAPRQDLEAELLAQGLDIASIRAVLFGEPRGAFSGRIEHLSVKATARKSDPLSSARGEGILEISDGTVRQASFDKRVVGIIRAIPVVGSSVAFTSATPGSSDYQVQGGMLKTITADFTVASGKLRSENIQAQGRFMNLHAKGDVGVNGSLDLVASAIYLEQNLKALAGPIKPLGSLFGTIGKIEIPLLIKGTIETPQVSADITRLQDVTVPGRALSPIFQGIESIVNGASGK